MKGLLKLTAVFAVAAASWMAQAAERLTVLDTDNNPVPFAKILLGYEAGNPFPGNLLSTNENGEAAIPADWKAALPVTVRAAGYITVTIPVLMPGEHQIRIERQESQGQYEVQGTTTNFGRLPTDGRVDFGLVVPALSRRNMLSFDLSSVLSPHNDTLDIIGNRVEVPSNITLPDQTENYIFPIRLNKPDYRVYVREPGAYRMYVTHGQFPLQRVVNEIRGGKSIFEVINHFTFIEAGEVAVQVDGNLSGVNLPVNQIRFTDTVSVKAPAFNSTQTMISLSLAERHGLMVPTDLKRLVPNQSLNLRTNTTMGDMSVLSLLVDLPKKNSTLGDQVLLDLINPLVQMQKPLNQEPPLEDSEPWNAGYDFNKLTFAMHPANGTVTPRFLPNIDRPIVNGNVITLSVPALIPGLVEAGAYMVLSEIEELGSGKVKNERRTRLWEVWSEAWVQQIELPRISFERRPDRKYRWEVLFLARPENAIHSTTQGPDLNTITHVTRNALEI